MTELLFVGCRKCRTQLLLCINHHPFLVYSLAGCIDAVAHAADNVLTVVDEEVFTAKVVNFYSKYFGIPEICEIDENDESYHQPHQDIFDQLTEEEKEIEPLSAPSILLTCLPTAA